MNGISQQFSDWVLLRDGTCTYVGKDVSLPTDERITLSPVYELITQPTQQGMARLVIPVLFYDIPELKFGRDRPTVAVTSLIDHEQRILRKAIIDCDEIIRKMRLQGSNIVTASHLPPGMKPPGHQ